MQASDSDMECARGAMADRMRLCVPRDIWEYRQWLVWRYEVEPDTKKRLKVPYYVSGKKRKGVQGSAPDADGLATFVQAEAKFRAGGFDGIGFALHESCPVKAIDIDSCVDANGKLIPEAQDILTGADSYSEFSPSGGGVRILVYGVLPSTKALNRYGPGQHIELFGTNGFVTITGNMLGESVIRPMTPEFREWLLAQVRPKNENGTSATDNQAVAPQVVTADQVEHLRSALSHLDADDYEQWISDGIALKCLGDVGLELWVEHGKRSPRFNLAQTLRKWATFKPVKASYQSIFARAAQRGWVNPAQAKPDAAQGVSSLLLSDKGAILPCEHNAFELLAAAARYAGLHFDEFLSRMRFGDRDWIDADEIDAVCWLQEEHGVSRFTMGHARNGARRLAYSRRRDSLREFVEALPAWDGVERIEQAFIDAWGAPDDELIRAASANFFIALIARALIPGSQVDTMWTFEGPQGSFKSLSLRELGGRLHAEISAPIGTADFQRELQGLWIAELSELDSLRNKDAQTIKRLLSATSDRFVQKYENHARSYPRRAVAVATTNEPTYWQDSTGARRLIPIACGEIRIDLISASRLQWFAEARAMHAGGATWWNFPQSITQAQEDRQQIDPWEDTLRKCMRTDTWPTGVVWSADLIETWLRLEPSQQGGAVGPRLGRVMRRLGYVAYRIDSRRGWKPSAIDDRSNDTN